MRRRTIPCIAATAASLAMASVQAQLSDPTRPPQASAASSGEALDTPATTPATQLQSVLISSRRKLAIINGTMVPLGGMLGEAKVVKITETEVVLQKGNETEVLKLFPGVDKQPVKRGAARARDRAMVEKSSRQGRSP